MKVKNFEQLATTPERRVALAIIEAGLMAIDTRAAVEGGVIFHDNTIKFRDHEVSLFGVERIFFVGVGKCALDAATVIEEKLGERLTSGIVLDVREGILKKMKAYAGTHPLPSEKNVEVTREIIASLSDLTERDLVIFVISGGGSTLLCQPDNFSYSDEAVLFECLTKSGADIMEVNTVRKHLSLACGGYLAKHAYPAQVVSLIFSDVPGGNLEFVASGPTVLDTTSILDAEMILEKYSTGMKCGFSAAKLIETPKDEKYFARVKNILFVSNDLALAAMAGEAARHKLTPRVCSTCLSGEAREVGRKVAEAIKNEPAGTILLYGGETTVAVRGAGKGGRNLELALAALTVLGEKEMLIALASDGRDNTDLAGAIADEVTKREAAALGLDPQTFLADNSSLDFWQKTGNYIITGHTGSNVADLSFVIKYK
jgi:glycerate-2-kinase